MRRSEAIEDVREVERSVWERSGRDAIEREGCGLDCESREEGLRETIPFLVFLSLFSFFNLLLNRVISFKKKHYEKRFL